MKFYRLVIYWRFNEDREIGGEEAFEAVDDIAALRYAHDAYQEAIGIADQSAIISDSGRLVWENDWPVRQTGDGGYPRHPPV